MQATTHLCPCCGKPRRIAHLLELYERNYRMLLRLLPELDSQATNQRTVSRSEHDCPLHLEVVERDRYTQTVRQIGRASCRESVCMYVYISVGAEYLKKKRANTNSTLA